MKPNTNFSEIYVSPDRAAELAKMDHAALVLLTLGREKQIGELATVLREYLAAGDETVTGIDDVKAMLRFGNADRAARKVLAKHEPAKEK